MEENGRQVEAFGEQAVASEGWAAVGGEWGQAEEEQQQARGSIQVFKYNKLFAGLVRD